MGNIMLKSRRGTPRDARVLGNFGFKRSQPAAASPPVSERLIVTPRARLDWGATTFSYAGGLRPPTTCDYGSLDSVFDALEDAAAADSRGGDEWR